MLGPQPDIDEAGFAALNQAIVQSATESQRVKKYGLLRKAKLTSVIRKKVPSEVKTTQTQTLGSHIEIWRKCPFTLSNLSQLVEDVNSTEKFKQYRGTIGVRKLLSIDGPPIQPIIDARLVPTMIKFMQMEDEPDLQLEAAWVLTNVASGTTAQTQIVMDKGAIPGFAKILRSNIIDLREQAIWALGNISGDSAVNRNIALKHGALQPLLKIVDDPNANVNTIKQGTWAISNLCRGRPIPSPEYVKAAIPTLFSVLQSQTDPETLTDAAWALSYLSGYDNTLDLVMSCANALPAMVSLLSHTFLSIVIPCLRTFGNICAGDEPQTEAVVSCPGFLEKIWTLLEHTKKSVRRECIWIMSNITAGTPAQTAKLFRSFPFVQKLIWFIANDSEEIKREALWVFSNALKHSEFEQCFELWNSGILYCYISILETTQNPGTLKVTLDGIYYLLKFGQNLATAHQSQENKVLIELESRGVLDKFDILQDFDGDDVYQIVVKIIRDFLPFMEIRPRPEKDEDEDSEFDEDDDDEGN